MRRQRIDVKKVIKKRIEQRHLERVFIEKVERENNFVPIEAKPVNEKLVNDRDRQRIYGNPNGDPKSTFIRFVGHEIPPDKGITTYQKKVFVDYDVVICIPSYDRYLKVKRLITQFYSQPTKYSFKIVLLNDGSKSMFYDTLIYKFPEIIYRKNNTPNGKILHWYCYNEMWSYLKGIQCHAVLQLDDDFIICENFLDKIMDLFFEAKEKNGSIYAIAPHLWSFKTESNFETWWNRRDFVDGIALLDDEVIKHMEYMMQPVDVVAVSKAGAPVRAWTQISKAIVEMRGIVLRTYNSWVYHDGNDDSKLHGDVRCEGKAGVYTQRYIEKI